MEEDISTVNKKHSFTAHNTYTEKKVQFRSRFLRTSFWADSNLYWFDRDVSNSPASHQAAPLRTPF